MSHKKLILILSIFTFFNLASANDVKNNFTSSSTINGTCVLRADDFSFGEINQFATQFIASKIYVKCNKGLNYTIYGDSRFAATLFMKDNKGNQLQYGVLTQPNNAWSTIFSSGNFPGGITSTNIITGTGNGLEKNHNIYLRVYGVDFGNVPLATPGIYSDTFNISVIY